LEHTTITPHPNHSSGSGKTSFLNHVKEQHRQCIYIRQFHKLRPYIRVTCIPHFDPTQLPFWDIYVNEGTAPTIPVGGTMAGEFTAGLSGGQRKLLLFELIYQRTMSHITLRQNDDSNSTSVQHKPLLIVLDEPFAGVTDDFVPWIVGRLDMIRQYHNVVVVTNDHVATLMAMADNTITVSAIDRTKVLINEKQSVDRELCIMALSLANNNAGGNDLLVLSDPTNPQQEQQSSDFYSNLQFFWDVEIRTNGALLGIAAFTTFLFVLFLITFWNSATESAALILIAGDIIAFFSVNPYLLSLVDWRHAVTEEAEALLHSSKGLTKLLKTIVCTTLIFLIALVEYGMVNAVMNGLESFKYFWAMFFDTGSTTLPFVCYGLYTNLPHQAVETASLIPFLFLIFFSTTFSPGAGLPVLKELRYLISRFYFWCIVPGVQDDMEGCPTNPSVNMLLLCLTGLLTVILFFVYYAVVPRIRRTLHHAKKQEHHKSLQNNPDFEALQKTFYGKHDKKKNTIQQPIESNESRATKQLVEKSPVAALTDEIDC
jgi:hypothetical protein